MLTQTMPTVSSQSIPPAAGGDSSMRGLSVPDLVRQLSKTLESAVDEIHAVNSETKVLALNARIEAARAGHHGAAFGVVAAEMQALSDKTFEIANAMTHQTREKTSELMSLIGSHVRGSRLSDLARMHIDLIDRCLYERTCDVRWWATDRSLIDALAQDHEAGYRFASQRMGIILDAYTVYFDLVLCDAHGKIVANGRPDLYPIVGRDEHRSPWFTAAMSGQDGDAYGFQTAHHSPLVRNRPVLIYSTAVREDGNKNGRPIGALGVLFNWSGLAGPILEQVAVPDDERDQTECVIVDERQKIMASNRQAEIGESLNLNEFARVLQSPKGYFVAEHRGRQCCVAHALAPGFETYSTGWYSLIIQPK